MSQEQFPPSDPNPQEQAVASAAMPEESVKHQNDQESYVAKINVLEGVLKEDTDAAVLAQQKMLIGRAGGPNNAERVNIWEAVKKEQASASRQEVSDLLVTNKETWSGKTLGEGDVFDQVWTAVAKDMRGSTDPQSVTGEGDIVDFDAGASLEDLLEDEQLQDPEQLAKATQTIRLLVAHGTYKFIKWGNSGQLEQALKLMESYTERVPGFNPKEAGFDEAGADITMSLGALRADRASKPNYQHAKPERDHLLRATSGALERLRRTEAHVFLRSHDFELPPES